MNNNTQSPRITRVEGRGIPLRGNDIDTDRIIPARFMKCVTFDGLGEYAFYDARQADKAAGKTHPFDDARFQGGSVLVVGRNFGCGSSREHAPQALAKYGITALVGVSFAEIFAGNCNTMGIPAVTLGDEGLERLWAVLEQNPETRVAVDLEKLQVRADNLSLSCSLPPAFRNSFLDGSWDSTAVLLANNQAIEQTAARLPYLAF